MFKAPTNIWQSFDYPFFSNPITTKINLKQSNKIKICIQEGVNLPLFSNTNPEKNVRKKGRRKLKFIESNEAPLHTKDNDDNIKRKVKTHFHNFIVAYLNMLMKNSIKTKRQYKIRKLSSKITQDITIGFNKILLNTSMKNILAQVSSKFKNKDINLYYIEKISNFNESNLENSINVSKLNEIFNMTYREMFENYYLKSTKALFQNEKYDESFETHINNLINKYGYEYAMKFKQNAENFIKFYISSKQRVHRIPISNSAKTNTENNNVFISEKNNFEINKDKQNSQTEINNLKKCLNGKNDTNENSIAKGDKKYFEIIRDNIVSDGNNYKTQTNSSGNSTVSEEGDKTLLNKKRNGPFNVWFCE